MTVSGLNHITLSVRDIDRSFEFYTTILGFAPKAKWDKGAYLEAGNIWLALLVDEKINQSVRPDYTHIAFSCTNEAFAKLSAKLADSGFTSWQENTSEGASYYFHDPDEHKLELHVGSLSTRLEEMKSNPWAEFTFYT